MFVVKQQPLVEWLENRISFNTMRVIGQILEHVIRRTATLAEVAVKSLKSVKLCVGRCLYDWLCTSFRRDIVSRHHATSQSRDLARRYVPCSSATPPLVLPGLGWDSATLICACRPLRWLNNLEHPNTGDIVRKNRAVGKHDPRLPDVAPPGLPR